MKTEEIIRTLRGKHPSFQGQWACIVEFQRIDFCAVGTWPSTKFEVHGYEVKASRSDWLRELKDPAKSADAMHKVDYWWVAAPAVVVQDGELPDGWGHLEVAEQSTRIVVPAPRLRPPTDRKAKIDGNWYDRAAFAGMARRVAYAEADRDALMALGDVMDLEPALTASAIKTGRRTPHQRERAAAKPKRTNGSAKRRKRKSYGAIPRQTYTGW